LERFEVSFNNKAVKVWFYTVLPAIIVAIILFIILPYEQNRFVSLGLSLINILYVIWFMVHTKKKRNKI